MFRHVFWHVLLPGALASTLLCVLTRVVTYGPVSDLTCALRFVMFWSCILTVVLPSNLPFVLAFVLTYVLIYFDAF